MMRRIVLSIALLISTPVVARAAEDVKIGYVDMQRALNETEDGRKAKAALKKVFDQKQKELDERQTHLKAAIQDLEKKRTVMAPDKVREKEVELQSQMAQLQETYMRHQQDLQQKEAAETSKIYERMARIITKIAGAENFTMVLDKNQAGVIFAKQHLDLTNEVIRRYNAGEGAGAPAAGKDAGKKK